MVSVDARWLFPLLSFAYGGSGKNGGREDRENGAPWGRPGRTAGGGARAHRRSEEHDHQTGPGRLPAEQEAARQEEARRLIVAAYQTDYPDGSVELRDLPRYFGVPAEFVESSMEGSLDDAIVIVMGCSGLASDSLAGALVERGAGAVASWDGLVSAAHTDAATERLLELFVLDKLSVEEAVETTRAELGPDPSFGSNLLSYPPKD